MDPKKVGNLGGVQMRAPASGPTRKGNRQRTMAERLADPRPIAGGAPVEYPEEIQVLLARLGSEDADQALTTEELEQLDAALVAFWDEQEGEGAEIETLAEINTQIQAVRSEQTAAQEAETEHQRQVDEMRGEVHTEQTAEETEGEGTSAGETSTEETPAEETSTEETTEEAQTESEETPTEEQPQAVAATGRRPAIRAAARRRPSDRAPRTQPAVAPIAVTAAADVPGFSAGSEIPLDQIPELFVGKRAALQHSSSAGDGEKVYIARLNWGSRYNEDRSLVAGGTLENTRKMQAIERHAGEDQVPLTAAGGYCAPLAPSYDLYNISVDDQPVRDDVPSMAAPRGGVRFFPAVPFTELSDGGTPTSDTFQVWTEANDIAADATDPTKRKNCTRIECPSDTEAILEAIVKCVTIGNLLARTFPELLEDQLSRIGAMHARLAEKRRLNKIATASTKTSKVRNLGTVSDVLAVVDQVVAAARYRNRTRREFPMHLIVPEWLDENMRTDFARQAYGTTDERYALADAAIDSFYAARGVNVTRALDDEVDPFGAQSAGALLDFPNSVRLYFYPEGDFQRLDGGTLDLGLVRDSTLNSVNDYQLFSESWEQVVHRGLEAIVVDADICPDGSTSAPIDIDPCPNLGS